MHATKVFPTNCTPANKPSGVGTRLRILVSEFQRWPILLPSAQNFDYSGPRALALLLGPWFEAADQATVPLRDLAVSDARKLRSLLNRTLSRVEEICLPHRDRLCEVLILIPAAEPVLIALAMAENGAFTARSNPPAEPVRAKTSESNAGSRAPNANGMTSTVIPFAFKGAKGGPGEQPPSVPRSLALVTTSKPAN
jgi:hypothetical protein